MDKEIVYHCVYGIRDMRTGELVNAKCHGGGKLYQVKGHAVRKLNQMNRGSDNPLYGLVTFELCEVLSNGLRR